MESQLAGLLESLTDTQSLLSENEAKHVQDIKDVVGKYQREIAVYRIGGVVALVVIVGGAIYVIASK